MIEVILVGNGLQKLKEHYVKIGLAPENQVVFEAYLASVNYWVGREKIELHPPTDAEALAALLAGIEIAAPKTFHNKVII
ncbi:hypothetical protein A2160_05600 [Candidatus Beckwithbacteria bacterium RBG_13_42_9]|uniref:Uncharacterized protein n=1 Tax=Candidatus Beckwithbacteria bacterium RBG_13_42_9 TaxID=1797457 RepID=A0A1F5E660_9BACT|nr:MAG: hypothetical protein A2160_05600 [Candidatus Beckwithbacteria bacterium RBG_13_42_9]